MTVKTQPRTWVYARHSTDKQTQKGPALARVAPDELP